MNEEADRIRSKERYRILFKGIVQGVGFRPYLYRSAQKFNLTGFVKNTSEGVILEVEGYGIEAFIPYVLDHLPPLSEVTENRVTPIPVLHSTSFEILSSESTDKSDLLVSPDIGICDNCRKELFDPSDRRYMYPFINCTDCGPRMTIIRDLPYDRPMTTMAPFPMCPECSEEYHNPLDRRYHAQPISCYKCGPGLTLLDNRSQIVETPNPVGETARKLREDHIIAVKGIGGYHLACLASSDKALLKLRDYKKRQFKPFALIGTIEMIRRVCNVSSEEDAHLNSPAAPILLLKKKTRDNEFQDSESPAISEHVAPGQDTIGFMLPYTPLHHLLLHHTGEPLVMTSANLSDEPIVYKYSHYLSQNQAQSDQSPETSGLTQLTQLSDFILTHDRDIHLFADDSVARVFQDKLYMIRRSRGYVPFPVTIPFNSPKTVIGLGPMLKTTFTLIRKNKALTGPYIGDTESPYAIQAERFALQQYMKLFSVDPEIVVIDKHPLYPNRLISRDFKNARTVEIQHHKAHVGSLLAEKGENDPIIGIAMDGTGYGDDGNIWGGEFFTGDYRNLTRAGHLKNLFLPSGDKSIKEPWRFALSILYNLYETQQCGEVFSFAQQFDQKGLQQLEMIKASREGLRAGIMTSSCGRIFDAACSILRIGHTNDFDGHLPSILQAAAEKAFKSGNPLLPNSPSSGKHDHYTIETETVNPGQHDRLILNFLPLFHHLIKSNRNVEQKALIFHETIAAGITHMSEIIRQNTGINKVGLTGGVFQNTLLLELTLSRLKTREFQVLIHSEVPSNDGGISLGQAFLAAASEFNG